MLTVEIKGTRYWDEDKEEFVYPVGGTLILNHSLVSISKWESKWKIPFLIDKPKTEEQILDYIRCMTVNDVDERLYLYLTEANVLKIKEYIEDTMTATWFNSDDKGKKSSEVVTSELIYYWMTAFNIPVSFENWHINRLMTLIQICNIKNQPPKKHNKKQLLDRHQSVNEMRRAQMAKRRGGI